MRDGSQPARLYLGLWQPFAQWSDWVTDDTVICDSVI